MKKAMKKIEKVLRDMLEKRISVAAWMLIFSSVIFLRSFVEQFLAVSKPLTLLESIMEFIHNFYFFSLVIVLLWLFLSLILKVKPQKLSYVLIFSLFLAIVPSLIDMIKTHGQIFWSFYLLSSPSDLWRQYVTIFGHLPSGIVYFGTKITFVTVIFLIVIFIWFVTKSFWKAFFGAVATYSVLFFMGAFPSLFYYAYIFLTKAGKVSEIHAFNIAGFFGSPENILGVFFPSFQYTLAYKLNYIYFILLILLLAGLFWLISREKFLATLKNLRFPQIIYHGGMFFIGLGLGFLQYPNNFRMSLFAFLAVVILLISIVLSWMASVVINDINDFRIDKVSNSDRPLPQNIFTTSEYAQFGAVCFFLAVLGGVTIGLPFAMLLIVYQILAWFYSAAPYRIKKFPVLATLLSACASLIVLFLGYILMSDNQVLTGLSWRIIFLLMISYTISLPIKDFKDIEGDKKDGVWTVPVLFGEKNGRLIVATGVFISYMLSVFLLNEMRLFFWALIFGAITFMIINDKKIKPRALPAWVLGVVSIYFFILVWVAFV